VPIPFAAIGAGAALLGAIRGGSRQKNRGKDLQRAIATYRASKPTGYVTPEDERAATLTRTRYSESAGRFGEGARAQALNRYRARGLGGSPAQERTLGRIAQQEGLGVQEGVRASEEQLYNVRLGREEAERQKERDIFGVSASDAQNEQRRADLKQSTFMNSLLEFFPTILPFFSGGAPASPLAVPAGTGDYDPSAFSPGFRRPV
jgi:hypothetical protein